MNTGCESVTRSAHTIHNPDDPRHFMRIKPINARVRILLDDRVLAESTAALRVIEAGKDIYDPCIYLPREDIQVELSRTDKRTYCPLKGHASYFDLRLDTDAAAEIAWSYEEVLDFAGELAGKVAFYQSRVTVEEHPLGETG